MIMKKLHLMITYADFYVYLLPYRLLCVYNSIITCLLFNNDNKSVINMLNFLYSIILGLILGFLLVIGLILGTLGSDAIILDDYFVFMEGNSSGGQSGNMHGGSGGPSGSSGSGGPRGPLGENNNLIASSTDNSGNRNENQQVSFQTEELQDQYLKQCMAGRLSRYRIANAHTRDIYLDDSFTSAEHEYIADKVIQNRAAKALLYGPSSARVNMYSRFVEGPYPERRYTGKISASFINSVFL